MTVLQLKEILSAELLCGGDHLDREVQTACGSDTCSHLLKNRQFCSRGSSIPRSCGLPR